jgi:hypothetical protein
VRTTTLAVVLLTAIAIAASCGGTQKRDSRKADEIITLWAQIRDSRHEAGLPAEPRHEDVIASAPKSVEEARHVCPESHAVPPTCGDVCSIGEFICDNAEQICILADELGKDDQWAQDKCSSAKASCRDAKKLCCKCSEDKAASNPNSNKAKS